MRPTLEPLERRDCPTIPPIGLIASAVVPSAPTRLPPYEPNPFGFPPVSMAEEAYLLIKYATGSGK